MMIRSLIHTGRSPLVSSDNTAWQLVIDVQERQKPTVQDYRELRSTKWRCTPHKYKRSLSLHPLVASIFFLLTTCKLPKEHTNLKSTDYKVFLHRHTSIHVHRKEMVLMQNQLDKTQWMKVKDILQSDSLAGIRVISQRCSDELLWDRSLSHELQNPV